MSERRNCVWVVEVRRKGYFFAWKIASEGYDKRSMARYAKQSCEEEWPHRYVYRIVKYEATK